MSADLEGLEFSPRLFVPESELLVRALTHRSRIFDNLPDSPADNEQFEFLGDSVLGFLVSEFLVSRHPEYREGTLSKLKAHLVSAIHIYEIATRLRIGDYLVLGRSEEMSGGRAKKALMVNALEAIVAGIYLDGGMDAAREFIKVHLLTNLTALRIDTSDTLAHSKTTLQEFAQRMKLPMPRYRVIREEGPQHARTFVVEARLGTDLMAEAEGVTKKSAEQKAAQGLLEMLRTPAG